MDQIELRDAGGRSVMSLRVASEPDAVAAELRALLAKKMTQGQIADRYGVSTRAVRRWCEKLGIDFPMGRRPAKKPSKVRASGKKRGRPKKSVAN